MANFQEKLKAIFKNKLVKAMSIIVICVIGMIMLGKCSKVEAANFVLSDGTVSSITYNENQVVKGVDANNVEYALSIYSPDDTNFYFNYESKSSIGIYTNCTFTLIPANGSEGVFCSSATKINYNDNTNSWTTYFIKSGLIIESNRALLVNSVMSPTNVTIAFDTIGGGYNEGYTAGQESGYNQGYTAGQEAGYNTGFSAGQNSVDITKDNEKAIEDYIRDNNYHTDAEYNEYGESQYNKGYDDGESEGFTSGANANIEEAYNNGYSYGYNQGYTSGMSDADTRVNTSSQSYIIGFSAGVGSVDITADNGEAIVNYITSNNYHTDSDYLNYGKAQYTSGYNEGQYTMINSVINNANDKYKTNIINVCSDDKSKCNTFIESTNKSIYDTGYNDRDITTDNYKAIQTYLSDNNLYTQKQYEDFGYNKYLEGAGTAEGYEIGYEEGYKEGQTDAEVSILEFFPGIIGAIIGFFITLMQITIFGVSLFDIVGILFGIGLIILILKVMNGGGD